MLLSQQLGDQGAAGPAEQVVASTPSMLFLCCGDVDYVRVGLTAAADVSSFEA